MESTGSNSIESPIESTGGLTAEDARAWARTGALAAFALVLSYLESFIPLPVPIPGARLGLANIAILMALDLQGFRSGLAVSVIKVLVTGILFGSPLMIPFSAVGTLFALVASWLVLRIPHIHMVFPAIAGAFMHIVGQLLVATLALGTPLVWYSLPFLAFLSLLTGALTGSIAGWLVEDLSAEPSSEEHGSGNSPALGGLKDAVPTNAADAAPAALGRVAEARDAAPGAVQRFVSQHLRAVLAALLVFTVVVICVKNLIALAVCAALALGFALVARTRPSALAKGLLPLAPILVITALAQVLYQKQGDVVAQWGSLVVTTSAIHNVCAMFLTMFSLMVAVLSLMKLIPVSQLMGAFMAALKPFRRRGVWVEAFALALDVALEFTFILVDEFKALREAMTRDDPSFGKGPFWRRLTAYQKMLPLLARNAFRHADEVADRFAEGSYRARVS